jgi:hypothetical protein
MILGFSIFVICLLAIFVIIAVHECGHFLAGAAAGIPGNAMKIRLFTFPQHVALQSDGRWLHPVRDYDRYVTASLSLLKSPARAALYVSGGLLLQTLAFAGLVLGLSGSGVPHVWLIAVTGALISVPCFYLCSDLLFSGLAKKPCGDFSFLWKISPATSVALTIFVLGVHGWLLLHVLQRA